MSGPGISLAHRMSPLERHSVRRRPISASTSEAEGVPAASPALNVPATHFERATSLGSKADAPSNQYEQAHSRRLMQEPAFGPAKNCRQDPELGVGIRPDLPLPMNEYLSRRGECYSRPCSIHR